MLHNIFQDMKRVGTASREKPSALDKIDSSLSRLHLRHPGMRNTQTPRQSPLGKTCFFPCAGEPLAQLYILCSVR